MARYKYKIIYKMPTFCQIIFITHLYCKQWCILLDVERIKCLLTV